MKVSRRLRTVPGLPRDLLIVGALTLPLWSVQAKAQSVCDAVDDHLTRIECLEADHQKADAELNAAWPKVLASPPSGSDQEAQRQRIRASQHAWIAFRDADCAARADVGIPKYWRTNELSCLIEHTRARTEYLLYHYAS